VGTPLGELQAGWGKLSRARALRATGVRQVLPLCLDGLVSSVGPWEQAIAWACASAQQRDLACTLQEPADVVCVLCVWSLFSGP
jgi:hypothetical protein